MKFCILTRPRSGSHMLASALDSHPSICCHGEYGMQKYPLIMGRDPAEVRGWIVQDFMLDLGIDLDQFDKVILLLRDLDKRVEYRGVHFQEPTIVQASIRQEVERRDMSEEDLRELVRDRDHAVLHYEDLTNNKDIRELDWPISVGIADFLGVDPAPLKPLFYKPEILGAPSEIQ